MSYLQDILINFELPTRWKENCPLSFDILNKDVEEDKQYKFVNKVEDEEYKKVISKELIKILNFYISINKNDETQKFMECPWFKYIGDTPIICPITQEEIKKGDIIFLLTYTNDDKEIIYYLVSKSSYLAYVNLYYTKDCEPSEITEEQAISEVIFPRWGKDIHNDRLETDEYLQNLKDTSEVIKILIDTYDLNLLKNNEDEVKKQLSCNL